MELYPIKNMGNPENFGTRTKIKDNTKYKFFIMQNVCLDSDKEISIPYKIKSSNLWPDTKVADLENISNYGNIELIPEIYHIDLIMV